MPDYTERGGSPVGNTHFYRSEDAPIPLPGTPLTEPNTLAGAALSELDGGGRTLDIAIVDGTALEAGAALSSKVRGPGDSVNGAFVHPSATCSHCSARPPTRVLTSAATAAPPSAASALWRTLAAWLVLLHHPGRAPDRHPGDLPMTGPTLARDRRPHHPPRRASRARCQK
ncbi:hypothetical protein GCM10009727_72070 [Actinomadura napierensis]|uniref:Uncharacterized protein n=1 Tax=Actinomadura napierensis TaxID=267854 RepID=A0ABP5M2N3_9ACTN